MNGAEVFNDRAAALAYLTHPDRSGATPGSRYGRHSDDCAPVAVAVAWIIADATGDPITANILDSVMGLVVNDHDDPLSIIAEHGSADDRALVADLLVDDDPIGPADVFGVPDGLVTDVHQLIVDAGYDVPLTDVVALVAFLIDPTVDDALGVES